MVNGTLVEGRSIEVKPDPTQVVLQFTVPMIKQSVEYRLRDLTTGTTFDWTAPDRVVLNVPAGKSFSLYLAGALAADEKSADDGKRSLYVSRVPPTKFSLYAPATLLAGGPPLLDSSLQVPEFAAFDLSPDRRQALVYAGDPLTPAIAPFLVDLQTGVRTPLSGAPTDPIFCWAGWRSDGTLLLADVDGLWQVEAGRLTRLTTGTERGCRLAVESPDGRFLATWAPLRFINLDLIGAMVTVPDRFEPIAQDGGVSPHWSPEGDRVAIGNAMQSGIAGGPIETVIVDLTGKVVQRIADWWPVAWLPDGDLVVFRLSTSDKIERARLTREGQPSPRSLPPDGDFSPDGRWIIPRAFGPRQVIELATGRQALLPENVAYVRWRPDSTLLLVEK